ncbi:Glycerol-3-phosphate regulon repressor [Hartmannibacter diazotrophicus]|uniref:Glycerol-3-phosphate regulon repressor n=1 Tax=Hartmannibacter diazotrophicus TaxID=1482074 RepID=A0A2C9DDP4_9HYPH|nr:DeoR/GlpR family DNA-binding transcription regulator [Hartmannibacter diazotrophicus]SON58386.1 Glycerol-3-phosphate regulon repressor [Hartmannibacter diazotrophicus]
MRPSKRHSEILRILHDNGTTTISDLADRLSVSLETIRRDVKPLAVEGLIIKMHGAVALPERQSEAPFERRMREHSEAKRAIARRVAGLVADGDSLMMDTGTTTSFVARALTVKHDLTVVTNSADIARILSGVSSNRVYMAGGEIRGDNGAAFGTPALDFVRRFSVRHSIITIGAIDPISGPMDFDFEEAEFAAEVLKRGENRVIVTDAMKFNRSALVRVCDFDDIDAIISEAMPPPELARVLDAHGVPVLLADDLEETAPPQLPAR